MVHADEYHPVPEQSRSLQTKAGAVTLEQLFPGLLRRKRYQQSIKVSALEVQSSQSSTS